MIKTAKKKDKKAVKKDTWQSIVNAEVAYTESIRASVHYSSKTTNSNAFASGVRLGANEQFNGPYLSVSTLGPGNVAVDYVRGANPDAKLLKQVEAVADPKAEERFDFIPDEERQIILTALSAKKTRGEYNTHFIDARLRQVLFPIKDENRDYHYIALTPLNSAGLSTTINARIEALYQKAEKYKKLAYFRRTHLGYGGSNPQNVGRHVREMQRALVFEAPAANPEMRAAMAIYFRGPQMARLLRPQLNEYALWAYRTRKQSDNTMMSTLKTRSKECRLLNALSKATLNHAARMEMGQRKFIENGPTTSADHGIQDIERQLLDSDLRTGDFNRLLAIWLAELVGDHRFRPPGTSQKISIGLEPDDIRVLARVIEEGLK